MNNYREFVSGLFSRLLEPIIINPRPTSNPINMIISKGDILRELLLTMNYLEIEEYQKTTELGWLILE